VDYLAHGLYYAGPLTSIMPVTHQKSPYLLLYPVIAILGQRHMICFSFVFEH